MIPLAILGPVERVLTDLLEWLHTSVGLSWGFSIIALTLLVRIVIVPLTVKQVRSMQKLQVVAPQLKALQQKYKHDKQRQQQEIMNFYRENKVNPASSCLPIVLQVPVFIALFFVLRDFEREVFPHYPNSDLGFLGIVPNITEHVSSHWSGYLLVVLYVASQVVSTIFMSATMDRTQRMIFMALPFVFVFFIIRFPTGLMLYWVTTNLWTVGQGVVTRRLIPKPAPPPKRSSRAQPEAPARDGGDGGKAASAAPRAAASGERRVRRRKKRGPQARR
ncbi:MAG: YidC/Oxa1 family membrane protein insertase [Thermoleophilia bacterium]|nr:YidC/Oxa1 family membrane protein insertase [Thermoleophilia bacterium]